jgi:GDP-D-mannose 3',5'-epimerase
MKTALVCGAGGFIGSHLVKRLKADGYWVRGADIKRPGFSGTEADDFLLGDLCNLRNAERAMTIGSHQTFDEVYQLAADMGGAGYIFTGHNDAGIMHNSAQINLNIGSIAVGKKVGKLFYSSSACIYPTHNQLDSDNPRCHEDSAYPAAPDSEYGWEKLFSERFYLALQKNHGLDVSIARYHNIFGPEGTWDGGREKAPAALCRKVIRVEDGGTIDIWGTGKQTRSFLYIDECIEGTLRLMRSDFSGPVNIGSEEMVSINEFAEMIIEISGKDIKYQNVDGPMGVNGRNSDNKLLQEKLGWQPHMTLHNGLYKTYKWIEEQNAKLSENTK